MNQIVKISEEHYIIVDYSEMTKNDFVLHIPSNTIIRCMGFGETNGSKSIVDDDVRYPREVLYKECKHITHSTKPLETTVIPGCYNGPCWNKIKQVSLSEIEELIYGYSVEKMAEEILTSHRDYKAESFSEYQNGRLNGIIEGIEAHQELTKDKLFTVEDMMKAIQFGNDTINPCFSNRDLDFIQSLLPKTEWDCEIDENNKITLV